MLEVVISMLVMTATTISSTSRVSPGKGEASLHGFKIHRHGVWGIRVASGPTLSPSHSLHYNYSPLKVCRVLNKHLCMDKRC